MASAAVTTNTGNNLSVTYSYTEDLLTSIETETTKYDFTYGDFSLRSEISIGSRTLASYSYTSRNNYLQSLDYGNGDRVKYTYDKYGRITKQTYEDGDTVTYLYDNDGALATVTDSATGRTTTNYYDFAGQLRQYVEKGADFSHSVRYTYDDINNLTALSESINGTSYKTSYAYDNDNRIVSVKQGNTKLTYSYDGLNRVYETVLTHGDKTVLTESYEYKSPASGTTSGQVATLTIDAAAYNKTYTYKYNDNGDIININDGEYSTTYLYDSANQLIRENNPGGGYTYVWTYDAGGNIEKREKYPFTSASEEVSGSPTETVEYEYSDSQWKDLLTQFDGKEITYDTIGNMLTLGNTESFAWEHGRELSTHSIPAEMAIITQPKDFKGVNGADVTFSIKATGEDLSYQWQLSNNDGATWYDSTATGYNTNAISGFTATENNNGRLYRCVVTDGNGNKRISSAAELILVPIAITDQPNNFYGYEGKAVTFSLTASGDNLTYQWQLSNNDGATWHDSTATGYNTNSISGFTATQSNNGRLYRCIITDGSGNTLTSNEVKLNTTDFAIYRNPSNVWGVLGDEVSFSVRTYSTTSVTYQWQYSSDGGNTWKNSPATGNKTNTLTGLEVNDTRLGLLYRCKVTDENGAVLYSTTARIRLKTDTWRYTYDANGMRTQRTDGYTTYEYVYNGSSLTRMTVGDDVLTFGYDASGTPLYVQWNSSRYFYVTNIQGDVVAIVSVNGIPVVEYTYDAWGNILSVDGSRASNLGKLNPLRYRGYVYDTETGLYYLQSRYYNPEMGRFINPDDVDLLGANGDFASLNLFAYCGNNPVIRRDTNGFYYETVLDVGFIALDLYNLFTNKGWKNWKNWAALGLDVAFTAVPFATGGGQIIKAGDALNDLSKVTVVGETMGRVEKFAQSVNAVDNLYDGFQAYDKLSDMGGVGKVLAEIGGKTSNAVWLYGKLRSGYTVVDIGIDISRAGRSLSYMMERAILNGWKLRNAIKTAIRFWAEED